MTAAEQQREYYFSVLSDEESAIYRQLSTAPELMEFILREYESRPAVSDGKTDYTYRELYERVAARRGYLKGLGFIKGDRIAVYSPNTVEAMELYLAIITSGCVGVFLPSAADSNSLPLLCKKFRVSGLFYDKSAEANTENVTVPKYTTEFVSAEPIPAADIASGDICSICLTSGTTGIPKGAVLTHGAVMRGVLNGCYIPGGSLYKSCIALLPFSHVFGLIYSFLSRLFTGGKIYECRDVKASLAMIPILKPEMLVIVPGLAEAVAALTKIKGKAFSESLSALIVGGASVSPRLTKTLYSLGLNTYAGYGLTEAACLTAANKSMLQKPESIGVVYPEQQVKIVDGELRLKGDNIMLGYFDDEENTKAAFDEDGWFKTGDLARFDEDGYVYITGRIKNLIILDNGENVSPEELEELLYRSEYVKDCLVKEDEVNGRGVIAAEILPFEPAVSGMSGEEQEQLFRNIVKELNGTLPSYKQISKVTVRKEDFKRTSSMKIARN